LYPSQGRYKTGLKVGENLFFFDYTNINKSSIAHPANKSSWAFSIKSKIPSEDYSGS
jgi:hypothetical protein